MNIAVLLKSIPETAAVPSITADARALVTDHLNFVSNPYDEHALEEAVRLKEKTGGLVTLVSLGTENARKSIRAAFAVGADEAFLINDPRAAGLSGRGTAEVLAQALKQVAADIVLAGKQAVDADGLQVPVRVAQLLGIPHASAVTSLVLDGSCITVDRELEGGHLVLQLPLPALVTVQKGINTPRYPTLPDTLRAKQKPIRELKLEALGLDPTRLQPRMTVEFLETARPSRRQERLRGHPVEQARELVSIIAK